MSMNRSLGSVTPSTTHLFRPRWSKQWTVGEVLAKRDNRWLVHYLVPGFTYVTDTDWFPPRRRVERHHDQ